MKKIEFVGFDDNYRMTFQADDGKYYKDTSCRDIDNWSPENLDLCACYNQDSEPVSTVNASDFDWSNCGIPKRTTSLNKDIFFVGNKVKYTNKFGVSFEVEIKAVEKASESCDWYVKKYFNEDELVIYSGDGIMPHHTYEYSELDNV